MEHVTNSSQHRWLFAPLHVFVYFLLWPVKESLMSCNILTIALLAFLWSVFLQTALRLLCLCFFCHCLNHHALIFLKILFLRFAPIACIESYSPQSSYWGICQRDLVLCLCLFCQMAVIPFQAVLITNESLVGMKFIAVDVNMPKLM